MSTASGAAGLVEATLPKLRNGRFVMLWLQCRYLTAVIADVKFRRWRCGCGFRVLGRFLKCSVVRMGHANYPRLYQTIVTVSFWLHALGRYMQIDSSSSMLSRACTSWATGPQASRIFNSATVMPIRH